MPGIGVNEENQFMNNAGYIINYQTLSFFTHFLISPPAGGEMVTFPPGGRLGRGS